MIDCDTTVLPDDEIVWSPNRLQDGIGFVATPERGLLVTRNGGRAWTYAFAAIPEATELPATAVAISPTFPHDGLVIAAIPGGIGRSRDQGTTWDFASLPGQLPIVTCLLILRNDDDTLMLAGTLEDGVARSIDGGMTWSFWNGGLFDHEITDLESSNGGTLTATTPSGAYVSKNTGRSWQPRVHD